MEDIKENQGNPSLQSLEFQDNLKKLNNTIREAYDYNNKVMEQCYDGVYEKN